MSDEKSLAHTKWNCKYHVVFAPKYRRKVFFGEKREAIGKILRKLCEWKGVEIHEAELCPDHVHMLVSIPPKIAVSSFMGYLKGKSKSCPFPETPPAPTPHLLARPVHAPQWQRSQPPRSGNQLSE